MRAGLSVRPEAPADHGAVRLLLAAAFEGPEEAALVDRLRGEADAISLVAEADDGVRGHILFTRVTVGDETPRPAMALGPMAVEPSWQRRGIGSALVEAGLARCREAGHEAVFVLGHSDYYPRFGFRPAAPCWFRGPEFAPAFFSIELVSGGLRGLTGKVRYHPAFDDC